MLKTSFIANVQLVNDAYLFFVPRGVFSKTESVVTYFGSVPFHSFRPNTSCQFLRKKFASLVYRVSCLSIASSVLFVPSISAMLPQSNQCDKKTCNKNEKCLEKLKQDGQ